MAKERSGKIANKYGKKLKGGVALKAKKGEATTTTTTKKPFDWDALYSNAGNAKKKEKKGFKIGAIHLVFMVGFVLSPLDGPHTSTMFLSSYVTRLCVKGFAAGLTPRTGEVGGRALLPSSPRPLLQCSTSFYTQHVLVEQTDDPRHSISCVSDRRFVVENRYHVSLLKQCRGRPLTRQTYPSCIGGGVIICCASGINVILVSHHLLLWYRCLFREHGARGMGSVIIGLGPAATNRGRDVRARGRLRARLSYLSGEGASAGDGRGGSFWGRIIIQVWYLFKGGTISYREHVTRSGSCGPSVGAWFNSLCLVQEEIGRYYLREEVLCCYCWPQGLHSTACGWNRFEF